MEFKEQALLEQFRSVITIGSAGLKSALIINGGGVIALLAYLGSIQKQYCIAFFVVAMLSMCLGIALAVSANVLAYIAQLKHLNQLKNNEEGEPAGTPWGYSSVALVVVSILSFIVGVIFASIGFMQ